jgi:SAM-dependent MidA family methyltransferase
LLFSFSDIPTQSRYKGDILKDFDQVMQLEASSVLPKPDTDSAAHSQHCADFIRTRIRDSGGSISFAEYMQHALYAPGLGYYAAGSRKFGADGDFVTAPEVSSLFGSVVARQCAEVLAQIDGGSILEFGAGSGALAVDILAKLHALGALPERYQILEVSADLRERQERRVRAEASAIAERIEWINAIPGRFSGVIIANEVLDALPFERFVRRKTVRQQRVVATDDGFEFAETDAPRHLVAAVESIESDLGERLPDGFASEVSLAAPGWVNDVLGALQDGVVFLFDYGVSRREYYAPDRIDGWLRCHYRHHAHNDPLVLPGIQDITAWVDFTAVAEAATGAGADITGYVNQAQFLMSGGLAAELQDMTKLPTERQLELSGQVKILTLPGEMGENFKCLGVSRGTISPPSAFTIADRTHTL